MTTATFADVQEAARRLEGITVRTPLLENARVNARLGGRLRDRVDDGCLGRDNVPGEARVCGLLDTAAGREESPRESGQGYDPSRPAPAIPASGAEPVLERLPR